MYSQFLQCPKGPVPLNFVLLQCNALSWSRKGARCVFRISFGPKSVPKVRLWSKTITIYPFCTNIDADDGPYTPSVQKLCTTFYGSSFIGCLSWIPKTKLYQLSQFIYKPRFFNFFMLCNFFNNLLHLTQFLSYFLLFFTTKVLLESLHGESFYHKSSLGWGTKPLGPLCYCWFQ